MISDDLQQSVHPLILLHTPSPKLKLPFNMKVVKKELSFGIQRKHVFLQSKEVHEENKV
jgi:hypothetical protein